MPEPQRLAERYELIDEVGRGGFAVVYRARDTVLDRIVALKILHPYWNEDPSFAARFRREARSAGGLSHANVVTIFETGEAEGQLYIAMEYLPGRSLEELLEEEGALSLEQAVPILEQLANALDYAHEQGMIHRDVKPGNIVVEETDRGIRATLTDFGLARAAGGGRVLTSHGMLVGSPEYMAPEQADPERAAHVGPAADRYALGIIAYQLLTGRVPFPGNTPATLNAHEHKPVPRPRSFRPGLPAVVEEALLKMLAKAPEDRFPSASAFVGTLQDALLTEEQDALLEPLYKRLQSAAARGDWSEVLALGGQIRAVAPDYRDLPRWMAQARQRLRRPRIPTLPTWVWAIGGVVVLGLVVGSLWLAFGGARPTAPTRERGAAPIPTSLPTREPTDTPAPTSTPTREPTDTPGTTSAPIGETAGLPPGEFPAGEPWTRPADKMVMVHVPGGTFRMGSWSGDADEKPVHRVTLDGFWIDQTEVTNAQYALCVADDECPESDFADDADLSGDDYPVVGV
ncbi:MAG: protein kinase, partial [Anaerolineae bacterium]